MERWRGRVALVTGASSGIGASVAKELVKYGLKVVGVARRVEKIEEYINELSNESGKLFPLKGDVSKEEDILAVFDWIRKNLGGVDVVINNAAVLYLNSPKEFKTEELQQLFDVNVIGLSICTREGIKSMKERGVDDGHIIHINSVAGQYTPTFGTGSIYAATKHSVRVLTEGLRRELVQSKSKIKITSISPGVVNTEMADKFRPKNSSMPQLDPKDITDAVVFTLGTKPHVQVHEITIRPVGETL